MSSPTATPHACHSGMAACVRCVTPPAMWLKDTVVIAAATMPSNPAVACCILIRRVIRADNGCLALAVLRGLRLFGRDITFAVTIELSNPGFGGQALVGVISTFGGRSWEAVGNHPLASR